MRPFKGDDHTLYQTEVTGFSDVQERVAVCGLGLAIRGMSLLGLLVAFVPRLFLHPLSGE